MEKRRKEAVRRHKTREKSPFPFHIPGPCWCEGSFMLRVPPASAAPPGKSWAVLALSLPFLGSVWAHEGHEGGPWATAGGTEVQIFGACQDSLTSGEHHRADIHCVGALQPTLVIPACCPHLTKAWEGPRTGGEIKKKIDF